ncbi:2OG-Fe(II) oxygenase family protein [Candidatus Thiothrix anitrata]|jgi:predicted 2-oxoglutarate/Fe(II)-dependent dioxygenase YbiX|uniref:2OG-Fe(II) oxygenase n=1 Tax=Candidatus Thiothrix anitrata TaxID=2823902 RepID=A0ABX7X739_9GAMM|nr:2OG-Fe(II) oxygenase [Candidatus Thiothrix anitrata]QTR51272.1 2OG-Fe(II) oxygenase [Candidatus Thiothrix anitrata]
MTESRPPLQTIRELAPNSFIFEKKDAIPGFLCDNMVARFEQNIADQYAGRLGQDTGLNQTIKKTTDIFISGDDKPHWKDVDNNLHRSLALALREFRETFPYFKGAFKDMGYNLQRYQPGEYYHWHIDGGSHQFAERQLVALWYLNDVPAEAGGTTDFLFQNLSVQPEKGKLVLFPPFWTHEHRAGVVKSGAKYIATTWVIFA